MLPTTLVPYYILSISDSPGNCRLLEGRDHLFSFHLCPWYWNLKASLRWWTKLWSWWNSSWAIKNSKRWFCESAILNMPPNLENSAVAIGLEKVSFHSNPKEGQCQRKFKLLHSSDAQLCLTLCNPTVCSIPGLPVHHQLLELVQTHVHQVIQLLAKKLPHNCTHFTC